MQKSKMTVWRGLTNSSEKKRVKSKGEKDRYKHLNAEFQRIARRDKKPFEEKVESEKVGLKLNIQKTKIIVSGPIT